jgi:hypothetical protein
MYIPLVIDGTTAEGNGAPSGALDGVPIRRGVDGLPTADAGFTDICDEAEILVEAAATADEVGTVDYVRIWLYYPKAWGGGDGGDPEGPAGEWFPMGAGTAADKGKLNGLNAELGETEADKIRHAERIRGFRDASRIYAEYGALTEASNVYITLVARG